jgi:hypothetical protein
MKFVSEIIIKERIKAQINNFFSNFNNSIKMQLQSYSITLILTSIQLLQIQCQSNSGSSNNDLHPPPYTREIINVLDQHAMMFSQKRGKEILERGSNIINFALKQLGNHFKDQEKYIRSDIADIVYDL